MLWKVVKPEHSGLYWLDDVHKGFYRNMFDEMGFDDCLPREFLHVLEASGKTKELFQSVFVSYKALTPAHQQVLRNIYDHQVDVYAALSDLDVELISPNVSQRNGEHRTVWKACKELGGYLYSTTLGLDCFAAALVSKFPGGSVLNSMDDHYVEFSFLNGEVCPFCGLEYMVAEVLIEPEGGAALEEEKQQRASYDHYLPKKHYPFLSVDFNNMVPCCDVCNEDFKREKDVLQDGGARTLAFRPYFDEKAELDAEYISQVGDFSRMKISIRNVGDELEAKTRTWDFVFKVVGRANHILKKSFEEERVAPVLCEVDNIEEARRRLSCEAMRYQSKFKSSRESFFKSLSYDFLSKVVDEDLLVMIDVVNEIYSERAQAISLGCTT